MYGNNSQHKDINNLKIERSDLMGYVILIYIFLFAIGLWIMYAVIKSAIDGSQTAEDIREIRKMLSKQYSPIEEEKIKTPEENNETECTHDDVCPACHSNISPTDKKCPSCGLTFMADDDNNV